LITVLTLVVVCYTMSVYLGGPKTFGVLQPRSLGIGNMHDPVETTSHVTVPNLIALGQTI